VDGQVDESANGVGTIGVKVAAMKLHAAISSTNGHRQQMDLLNGVLASAESGDLAGVERCVTALYRELRDHGSGIPSVEKAAERLWNEFVTMAEPGRERDRIARLVDRIQ